MSVQPTGIEEARIETITPERAHKLLSDNKKPNRLVTQRSVKMYARAMIEGRWVLNGETIQIDTEGDLANGQHRLLACIEAECAFTTWVVYNVPPKARLTIDDGLPRKAHQFIATADGMRNAKSIVAAVRLIVVIRAGMARTGVVLATDEIHAFLEQEPGVARSVSFVYVAKHVIASGLGGALHYLFAERSQEESDKFFTDLG